MPMISSAAANRFRRAVHRSAGTATVVCALVLTLAAGAVQAAEETFTVRFSEKVRSKPYTGRVYIFFSRRLKEPRQGPRWFHPEKFIAKDVRNWKPGTPVSFAAGEQSVLSFPKPLSKLKLAGYRAQAVVRFNPYHRKIGTGPGNGFSNVVTIENGRKTPVFVVDKLVPKRTFRETKWVKLVRVKSKLLSRFHNRDVYLRASVRLPASYHTQPRRQYPTIFSIPGFGGTHRVSAPNRPIREQNKQGIEFLRVRLDPSCPRGHHVFADSENNGPYGEALITELIPAYENSFRAIAKPTARFLTGHSSGGWSSLWLQVTYPDHFGGTWSTAPDPVDFRDFQRINLYRPGENMYRDADGNPRPLARMHGRVVLWYRDFAEMERVLGYGGQLHSFEAVFSPRGKDGNPLPLWDRKTGRVHTKVAKTWEKYDIRLRLERNWERLGPKLKGKLHVFMGDRDTFYLEGAVRLLKKSLKQLGSDAVVEIHRGKDHMNLLDAALARRIRGEMVDTFLKTHANAR